MKKKLFRVLQIIREFKILVFIFPWVVLMCWAWQGLPSPTESRVAGRTLKVEGFSLTRDERGGVYQIQLKVYDPQAFTLLGMHVSTITFDGNHPDIGILEKALDSPVGLSKTQFWVYFQKETYQDPDTGEVISHQLRVYPVPPPYSGGILSGTCGAAPAQYTGSEIWWKKKTGGAFRMAEVTTVTSRKS